MTKKVAGSERLNTAKIIEGLRSFVTGVVTNERKFYAMQGNEEFNSLLDKDLNLDAVKAK